MRYPLELEGFENHELTLEPGGLFAPHRLYLDGRLIPPGVRRGQVVLRRDDGEPVPVTIHNRFIDPLPRVVAYGHEVPLAGELPWYQWLWSGWPLLLIARDFLLGAVLGFAALALNVRLFRSGAAPGWKYAGSGLIGLACWLVYFFIEALTRQALGLG